MESKDNGTMKENKWQPGVLCPMKIPFKNEDKIKSAFRQKITFTTSKLKLKERNYLWRKRIVSDGSMVTQERIKTTTKRKFVSKIK